MGVINGMRTGNDNDEGGWNRSVQIPGTTAVPTVVACMNSSIYALLVYTSTCICRHYCTYDTSTSALRPVFAAHEAPAYVVWRYALIVRLLWARRVPYMSAHPTSRIANILLRTYA